MSLPVAAAHPAPVRRPPRPAEARPELRVVAAGRRQVSRVPFLVVCACLLMAGLVAVLVLNTTISQSSFALAKLQARADTLDDQALALRHDIDDVSSSRHLAERAAQLGMSPASAPMFLDPQTGAITGSRIKGSGSYTVVTGRAAAAPASQPSRPAVDAASASAGLGLGGGLLGPVASLAAR